MQFIQKLIIENKAFIIFCCIGVVNTLLDMGTYIVLTRSISFFSLYFLYAHFCGFIVGSTSSFIMNRAWTFDSGQRKTSAEYIRFFSANCAGLLLHTVLFYSLVAYGGFYDIVARLALLGFMAVLMFYVHKTWTFKPHKAQVLSNTFVKGSVD